MAGEQTTENTTSPTSSPTTTEETTTSETSQSQSTPEEKSDADKLFDEEKKGEDEKESEEDEKKDEGEPELLTLDKLAFPEGLDKESPLAAEFVEALNDKDLSAEGRANKLLDLYKRSAEEFENQSNKLWLETNEKWQDELISEMGEQKLEASLAKVGSLIESFDKDFREAYASANPNDPPREFGKELREAFTLTGAGNNPAIAKFLFWAADQLGEGAPLSGTPAGGTQQSRADKLFGS